MLRAPGSSAPTSRSSKRIRPRVGCSSPEIRLSSVVLPQPEGPAIETYSPRRIVTCTPESAWVSTSSVVKTLWMSSSRSSAAPAGVVPLAPAGTGVV
jgi:hypothetical protein